MRLVRDHPKVSFADRQTAPAETRDPKRLLPLIDDGVINEGTLLSDEQRDALTSFLVDSPSTNSECRDNLTAPHPRPP